MSFFIVAFPNGFIRLSLYSHSIQFKIWNCHTQAKQNPKIHYPNASLVGFIITNKTPQPLRPIWFSDFQIQNLSSWIQSWHLTSTSTLRPIWIFSFFLAYQTKNLGIWNLEFGIWYWGFEIRDLGFGIWDWGSGSWDLGPRLLLTN